MSTNMLLEAPEHTDIGPPRSSTGGPILTGTMWPDEPIDFDEILCRAYEYQQMQNGGKEINE